jgi:hypothetical protein
MRLREQAHREQPSTPDANILEQGVASRPTSIDSQHSDRACSGFRSLFTRRSSVQVSVSCGYEEIVFDSRSEESGSQASIQSNTSCASGRRGPLGELARAGMKAVKRIGACWRCKL